MKRRAPLKRSTKPIALKSRPKQRRATPRRRPEGTRDESYKAAVRALPCYAGGIWGRLTCGEGPFSVVDPDHQGPRGLGQKAPDDTCVPMCRRHHDQRQFGQGVFKDWTRERMRAWCDAAIAATRKTLGYGERVGGPGVIDMDAL